MSEVSVIIPLYNKGRFIKRALDSVFSQTYKDYEVVVIDDGSTDDGPEIVKHYSDSRLRLIHQANAGPGAARNRGMRESSGRFLVFLDADDEWFEGFLEVSFKTLVSNADCDVTAMSYFLGAERKDASGIFRGYGMVEGPWRLTKDISDYELKYAIYIFHSSSTLCRREVLERYGGFYCKNNCRYGEDYYLWLQVMLNHRIYRILRPLWWYHLEASELGVKDPACGALHPFLTDAETIRKNCPTGYEGLLERWFALFALGIAHEAVSAGNISKVRYLMRQFPLMRKFWLEYSKLKLKIWLPALVPLVGSIKRRYFVVRDFF